MTPGPRTQCQHSKKLDTEYLERGLKGHKLTRHSKLKTFSNLIPLITITGAFFPPMFFSIFSTKRLTFFEIKKLFSFELFQNGAGSNSSHFMILYYNNLR